jgi:hypothetical protein
MPEKRAAQNELLFRRLNEQIHKLDGNSSVGTLDAVCECGDEHCFVHVAIPLAAYVEVRGHPRRFIVAPGHESHDDAIIGSGEGFVVVEKPETAIPAQLAELPVPE